MSLIKKLILLSLLILVLLGTGCSRLFEVDPDVQAKQALLDLMAIQEKYRQKNKRYARNLLEIDSYNLKYHTGIVYLEIESAGKDKYRAISLPAESTTARVFAYDTQNGGFYEMGEEEVSHYVLGSLNHIRQKQKEKTVVDYLSAAMVICLAWFGLRMFLRYRKHGNGWVWWPYFLSILPLSLAVAELNHIGEETVFSPTLMGLMAVSFAVSLLCLAAAGVSFSKIPESEIRDVLRGFAICTLLIALFTSATLVHSYIDLTAPKVQRLYFKPGG